MDDWETVKSKKQVAQEKKVKAKENQKKEKRARRIDVPSTAKVQQDEGWNTVNRKSKNKNLSESSNSVNAETPASPKEKAPEIVTSEDFEFNEGLKTAIRSGESRIVKEMTQTNNVNHTIGDGLSPLMFLASISDSFESQATPAKILQVLLENGANINQVNPQDSTNWKESYTAVHYAVDQESPEFVKLLFKNGAKVESIDSLLSSVILTTSRNHLAPLTRVLLENGGNPNYKRSVQDHAFILLDAVKRNDHQTVKALLQAGADPTLKGPGNRTALHEACKRGNVEIVAALLEKGADVNAKGASDETKNDSEQKNTPLFDLVEFGTSNGKRDRVDPPEALEIAKLLIDKGADVNAKGYVPWDWEKTSPKGFTEASLLDYATKLQASGLSKAFLKAGAKKNRDPPYKTFTFYNKEDYDAFKVWWNQYLQSKPKK